jgi:ketosteroid isomerase-like protein
MGISDDQKIERINRLITAMNAGDYDATVELAHPDVVLVRAGGAGEVRGTDQLREWMEPDAFEAQVNQLLGFETHGDRVLARIRSRARGAGSGIEIDIVAWTVYRFDDEGLMTHVEIFLDHEEDEARRSLRA